MQPFELSVVEAAQYIQSNNLSPVELTRSVLDRVQELDSKLSAYVTVTEERAMAAARIAELEIRRGEYRGVLHGIPYALKDLIDVEGLPTTASSRVRQHHVATANSVVADRLALAGMVLTGKTHTHEFAFGLTTPQTNNPWAHDRSPGGSSGGSAAAVAYGGALAALGTDTGGSIRVPAALCGVVGLKPTFGLVSRQGVVPLSGSLDHVGPITRTVTDAAAMLDVIAQPRSKRSQSYRHTLGQDIKRVRVGVPTNYFFDHVAPDIKATVHSHLTALAAAGAVLVDVEIPLPDYLIPTQWGLMVPESATYHEDTIRRVPHLYGDDVRILLEAGSFVPVRDYILALRARNAHQRAWREMFAGIDILLTPTVPHTAPLHGQETFTWPDGAEESVVSAFVRLCAPANVLGLPALSVPAGFDRGGLPFGVQLIGKPFDEHTVLRVGHVIEAQIPA
ncbi:amidase [Cupriavidus necator]|uniref:amidase n=1 Tax=Cupriavidus necator TaxID=106590 RepID=UPI00339D6C53